MLGHRHASFLHCRRASPKPSIVDPPIPFDVPDTHETDAAVAVVDGERTDDVMDLIDAEKAQRISYSKRGHICAKTGQFLTKKGPN